MQLPFAVLSASAMLLWAGILVGGVKLSRALKSEIRSRSIRIMLWATAIWTLLASAQLALQVWMRRNPDDLIRGDLAEGVSLAPQIVALSALMAVGWATALVVGVVATVRSRKALRRNRIPPADAFS